MGFFDTVQSYIKNVVDEKINTNTNNSSKEYISFKDIQHVIDYSEPIKYYIELLNINPNNSSVLKELGKIYLKKKEHKKATEYYEKALKFDKSLLKDELFLLDLANLYYIQDQKAEAIVRYKQVLDINDKNESALIKLGMLFQKKCALEYYQRALKINPKNTTVLLAIANLYFEKIRNYDEAIKYFEKYLKLNPSDSEVKSFLPSIYNKSQGLNTLSKLLSSSHLKTCSCRGYYINGKLKIIKYC
jgi:tetratricopeptide (TPR) repeat protein